MEEMRNRVFPLEKLKGRYYSENLGVDGKITIRADRREIGWEVVDWKHLAQDRDQ
jgi:hypothetical protein